MLRTISLLMILLSASISSISGDYVCHFDYFEDVSKYSVTSVLSRESAVFYDQDCKKGARFNRTIGSFLVDMYCSDTISLTVHQQKRLLVEDVIWRVDINKTFSKATLGANRSGLRIFCSQRVIHTAKTSESEAENQ